MRAQKPEPNSSAATFADDCKRGGGYQAHAGLLVPSAARNLECGGHAAALSGRGAASGRKQSGGMAAALQIRTLRFVAFCAEYPPFSVRFLTHRTLPPTLIRAHTNVLVDPTFSTSQHSSRTTKSSEGA